MRSYFIIIMIFALSGSSLADPVVGMRKFSGEEKAAAVVRSFFKVQYFNHSTGVPELAPSPNLFLAPWL